MPDLHALPIFIAYRRVYTVYYCMDVLEVVNIMPIRCLWLGSGRYVTGPLSLATTYIFQLIAINAMHACGANFCIILDTFSKSI